jgi:molybdopterin converting factor small subunit
MPLVKLKIQNLLIHKKNGESTGFEVVSTSAKEGESILNLFRRLARKNEKLGEIVSYAMGQEVQVPTVIILNGRFLGPHELSGMTLKEGDELTILPLVDGG